MTVEQAPQHKNGSGKPTVSYLLSTKQQTQKKCH